MTNCYGNLTINFACDESYTQWRSVMQTGHSVFNLFCWYADQLWAPPTGYGEWRLPNVLFNQLSTNGHSVTQKGVLLQWRGNYVLPDGLIWHVCRVPLPKTEKSTDLGDYFSKWAKFSLKKINTEVRLLRVQGPYSRRHRKIIFDRTMSLVFTSNHLKFYLKTVWLFKTICDSRQPSSEILLFTQMYILRIFLKFYFW
jgi:hypothetical protein